MYSAMANKYYNSENFKNITGDQDDNNEDLLDVDEDHLIIAEEETSNKASQIEGEGSPDEDSQDTGGGLAVLMAAIDSSKTPNGCISDDPFTPEPKEPAADYAGESLFAESGFFARGNNFQECCFSWYGVGPIHRIDGIMDRYVYKDIHIGDGDATICRG